MYFFFLFSYISLLYTGLVTIIIMTYIGLYFIIYNDNVCSFSSPTSTCVVFFLSLYTCFFMYAILISISHMMP